MRKTVLLESPEKMVKTAADRASKRVLGAYDKKFLTEKKITSFSNFLLEKIDSAIRAIPTRENTSAFHFELIKTIESEEKITIMRNHFITIRKLLSYRKRAAIKATRANKKESGKIFKELMGRSASIMKTLAPTIKAFNSLQKNLKELPSIDAKTKTIVLAGYPNAGKTTILKRLTGSEPEIAPYPFTTKKLNVGVFEHKLMKIQVIDTPGLLDREPEKRNAVERKAVLAMRFLPGITGFVVDCSEQACPMEQQKSLFSKIRREFKEKECIVFLNKLDIASELQKNRAKELFTGENILEFPEEKAVEIREILWKTLYKEERIKALETK
ncbi:MAG: GTPase [Candidatus Diapherotrites archaeon]